MLPRTPSFRLDGKRAVVTGGSRGIGLGSAVALAEEGANVTIVARSKDQVFETVNKMKSEGFSVSGVPMDVTNIDSVKNLMDEKICFDGKKVIFVPFFFVLPNFLSGFIVLPSLNLISYSLPSLKMLSLNSSDNALTTDTPTPCNPPETLYES